MQVYVYHDDAGDSDGYGGDEPGWRAIVHDPLSQSSYEDTLYKGPVLSALLACCMQDRRVERITIDKTRSKVRS